MFASNIHIHTPSKQITSCLYCDIYFDSYAGFSGLKACCGIGGPYNFNASVICGDPSVIACDDPSKYIGWDGMHLTEAAYKLITQAIIKGPYSLPSFSSLSLNNANFGYFNS